MMVSPSRRQAALAALALDDDALLRACEVEYFIASGPGGQHRNTTASGVRRTHPPTELSVTATERRSQAQNKGAALERLRAGLQALVVATPAQHFSGRSFSDGNPAQRIDHRRKRRDAIPTRREQDEVINPLRIPLIGGNAGVD